MTNRWLWYNCPMHYSSPDQNRRFCDADQKRSQWIRDTSVVRDHEHEIYNHFTATNGPILELGGGEGLSVQFVPDLTKHLYIGTDIHLSRARSIVDSGRSVGLPHVPAVACDASALPFAAGSMANIFCRDLLHHLPIAARKQAVAEMARVLRPQGQVTIIEPNAGRSPMVAAFSLAIPTERMALKFHARSLRRLLSRQFAQVHLDHLEPSMLYRALLHYRFGRPLWHKKNAVRRLLAGWERLMSHMPQNHWCYVRARCRGPK